MIKRILCLTALCATLGGCVVAPVAPYGYYHGPYYGYGYGWRH